MKKKDEKTTDRCPNCGFCPHCGQSAKPRVVPMPIPYPQPYVAPYRRPVYWEEGGMPYAVWCGEMTSTEGASELRSVSVSYQVAS